MKRVYLDYAATTPLDPRVRKAMEPFFFTHFGNPSSIHAEGLAAKKAVDGARAATARALEARADEIIFTSGGTESNNLAIFGVVCRSLTPTAAVGVKLLQGENPHIITTNIEHSSVLEPLRELERQGRIEVSYISVESNGIVKPEKIIAAIRPNTVLISVMYANNEIGTIQPILKIGKIIKNLQNRQVKDKRLRIKDYSGKLVRPIFHTDACQAPLYLNCLVNALGVDLLTLDGHKIYGPKGVGALYVRHPRAFVQTHGLAGTPIAPQLLGGGQESGFRSTTENVPAIVGFAEALRLAVAERKNESVRLTKLRDYFHSQILKNLRMVNIRNEIFVNGDMKERLPNNINFSLPGVDTEMLSLQLDAAGIACSTKSSCLKDERVSYVVAALGGGRERAESSIRFTLGRATTKKDVEYCAKVLCGLLSQRTLNSSNIL